MSPTYFAVRMAAAEKRLEAARRDHNIHAMQITLGEMTLLNRAYYGAPQTQK
jgi:hypothetical protein